MREGLSTLAGGRLGFTCGGDVKLAVWRVVGGQSSVGLHMEIWSEDGEGGTGQQSGVMGLRIARDGGQG